MTLPPTPISATTENAVIPPHLSNSNLIVSLKEKINNGFKNKKVLLTTLDSPFLDNQYVFPYLGILYLISVGIQAGMRPKYIDQKENKISSVMLEEFDIFFTDEFNTRDLEQYRYFNLVGISCMTPQGKDAYKIRRSLKDRYPEMTIMLGGPHATHYTEEIKSEGFDIIVVGDGERVFQELVLGDINNLSIRLSPNSSPETLIFQDRLTEQEMNSYPIPYRDKTYIQKYNYLLEGEKSTTIVNSRGCPMGCAFCEDRRTIGRWYSPQHFQEEIQSIVDLGIKGIMIFDDLFAINPKKIKPYIEILKQFHEQEGVVYRCFGHAGTMSKYPEMAYMLSKSGCVELGFGAESASQEILNIIGKGTKVYQMHDLVENAIQAGIKVKAFFMVGLPGETEETFEKTYDFIKKYRLKYPSAFDFDCAVFFPYKGTDIGNVARLPEGKTMILNRQKVNRTFFQIRAKEDLSWSEIDDGSYGAYKKKEGLSDIVAEIFDWKEDKVLLSAKRIYELKEKAMLLSGRYSEKLGNQSRTPLVEGSIGSHTSHENNRVF